MHYNLVPIAHYLPDMVKNIIISIFLGGSSALIGCTAGKAITQYYSLNYHELDENLLHNNITHDKAKLGCVAGAITGLSIAIYSGVMSINHTATSDNDNKNLQEFLPNNIDMEINNTISSIEYSFT
jgi:hypothetical protein